MTESVCAGRVSHPPHYTHNYACGNPAKHTVGRIPVCGTHKRVAERWAKEGRLDTMAAFYWNVKTESSGQELT